MRRRVSDRPASASHYAKAPASSRTAGRPVFVLQCQTAKRDLAPPRSYVIRQSPNPIVAAKTPTPSCANRPRRPVHQGSLAFCQRSLFDQHHTRPAPRAELRAVHLPRDEKASSGLPLQPTDLPSLLTEQIAHFSPLLEEYWRQLVAFETARTAPGMPRNGATRTRWCSLHAGRSQRGFYYGLARADTAFRRINRCRHVWKKNPATLVRYVTGVALGCR